MILIENNCAYGLAAFRDMRVRYVGQTKNKIRRNKSHLRGYRYGATLKDEWMRSVYDSGDRVVMVTLELVPVEGGRKLLLEREAYWIAYFNEVYGDLLNENPTKLNAAQKAAAKERKTEVAIRRDIRDAIVAHSPRKGRAKTLVALAIARQIADRIEDERRAKEAVIADKEPK